MTADDDAVAAARDLLRRARSRCAAGGARTEALAEYQPARRVLLLDRPARMRPLGRVWRLGVVLLTPDGGLLATGGITRAVEPGHPGHVALSVEDRRPVLAAGSGPLLLREGRVLVRWSASLGDDAAAPFEPYLTERAELLLHPPQGA